MCIRDSCECEGIYISDVETGDPMCMSAEFLEDKLVSTEGVEYGNYKDVWPKHRWYWNGKKHIMRLYYHDDYEEWHEIGIIVGKDHPAFSEVEKISERSKKE